MTTLIHSKTSSRLLPIWLLRLLGYSSLAVTFINFVIMLCRRSPPTRQCIKTTPPFTIDSYSEIPTQQKSLRRTSSSLTDIYNEKSTTQVSRSPPPYLRTNSPQPNNRWRSRLVDNVLAATSVLKKKKRLTISMKNTILWNPSQDVNISNHAFHENAIPLLTCLCQRYEVFLLIHTNNEDDHDQIQRLLSPVISSPTQPLLNKSNVIYCKDEMAKIDLVQNVLCPAIHIEGGWELDDGEEIVRRLSSSVTKLVWVITRRRRTSFNKENVKSQDKDLLIDTVELTDSLLDTSLAREAGFMIDG